MVNNEIAIIEQACRGDKTALATLYQQHKTALYTYIYYRVAGDAATADDLTAELFSRMVAKIHQFQPRKRPFRAWLYTIARNLVHDHYRTEQREAQLARHDIMPTATPDPEIAVQDGLETDDLLHALRQLTNEQQEVVILRFIEGCSVAETAVALGKRKGAIKTMTRRALASLKRVMERKGGSHV